MAKALSLMLAQLNLTVGAIEDNCDKVLAAAAEADQQGADLLVCSELALTGYPPEDLVLKPAFLKACLKAVEELAADTADGGPGVVIGFPRQGETGRHNSVALLDGGSYECRFDIVLKRRCTNPRS